MKRLLIYTCCDAKYAPFIPLFCASLLYFNDDICIEIGTNEKVSTNIEKSITMLQDVYGQESVHIAYIPFRNTRPGRIMYEGMDMMTNTLRFIKTPEWKAEYVYITDIDVICMEAITDMHIKHMQEIDKPYSNMVRKFTKTNTNNLTGLHFTRYDFHYPVDIAGIDMAKNDEMILFDIVSRKTELDLNTNFRPVHGIHMSPNRPSVKGTSECPGWNAEPYRAMWAEFTSSTLYKQLSPLFEGILSQQVEKLDSFYQS